MNIARWYEAFGGDGLEIKRGDEWMVVGYIQKINKKRWDIRVNPYQDEGYALASCESRESAKAEFLRRINAIVEEPSR